MDFLEDELEEILNIFQQESAEILESMDKKLLVLEQNPKNIDAAMHLFRDAHSLKGSARMLGFNNIQNVAHKIEDVLGFIKEKKLLLDNDTTQVISKALGCISEMIVKTVQNKSEYISPDITAHILALENVVKETNAPDYAASDIQGDDTRGLILKNINKIEALIIEALYIFSKYKTDAQFESFEEIGQKLAELSDIFSSISQEELLELTNKTLAVLQTIHSPNEPNFEHGLVVLNSALDDIASKFSVLCDNNDIVPKNYYEVVSQKLGQKPSDDEADTSQKFEDIEMLLVELVKKIRLIESNGEFLPEIKESFKEVIAKTKHDNIRSLFETFLRMVDAHEATQTTFNKDTVIAISEIVKDSLSMIKKGEMAAGQLDSELLNQRALIIEQMSQMADRENPQPPALGVAPRAYSAQDWLDSIDSSSIKTLRINSSKLDQLVNQVGDLIVTRIKTTEQLNLARAIQNEFMDWQKSWHKLGHYIKYFDKKYLTGGPISREVQSTIAYNRQLMSLYNTHSEKMASLMHANQHLYKQLQENDIKLSAITTELEAMIKNMRVLPLATIFHLFPRMVHNIAKDKGKNIDFKVVGSDVSVDKKIIEDIKIPLMHIIRNSIDHGIEMPEEREAMGKNPVGSIVIRAKHQENKIIIDVEDDGRGIDIQKVKAKAVKSGLLTSEEAEVLPKEQIVSLIFYPGFSTEEIVTELSGRGLGLDIVHTKISQLNGRIDVHSELGRGTVTTIVLPASMATVKAFIVSEKDQPYAVPASSIKTVLRIRPEDVLVRDEKNYFIFKKRVIPIFTLSQMLQLKDDVREADKYTLMVIESENTTAGVIVEKLLGDQEILHKKLPLPLFKVKNISGITTLASGETCLILNVTDILSNAMPKKYPNTIVATNKALEMDKNSRYKILVVDDSLTTRTLQKNILANNGYQVCFATNALDGLHILDSEMPSLVVTDYEMPEMSGLEFVEKIREQKKFKDIPIVVLSSLKKEDWAEKFTEAGAQKYIQKGEFNQESFLKCISGLLEKTGF